MLYLSFSLPYFPIALRDQRIIIFYICHAATPYFPIVVRDQRIIIFYICHAATPYFPIVLRDQRIIIFYICHAATPYFPIVLRDQRIIIFYICHVATPYFPIALRDQHVDKDADLTWRCYGKGEPDVNYKWYRNGEPLVISELVPADQARYSIDNNVLSIRQVSQRDEAMYQCYIKNTLGSAFSSAQLRTICECRQ